MAESFLDSIADNLGYLLILALFAVGASSFSDADMGYIKFLIDTFDLVGLFLVVFFIIYGSPAYIVLSVLSFLFSKSKIRFLSRITSNAFSFASVPIHWLSYGFLELIMAFRYWETEAFKNRVKNIVSALVGVILFFAFYQRLVEVIFFPLALLCIIALFLSFMVKDIQPRP